MDDSVLLSMGYTCPCGEKVTVFRIQTSGAAANRIIAWRESVRQPVDVLLSDTKRPGEVLLRWALLRGQGEPIVHGLLDPPRLVNRTPPRCAGEVFVTSPRAIAR